MTSNRCMLAPQPSVNTSRHRRAILHVGDYQEVYVAVRSHLAARGRAEQDNPLRAGHLRHAPDDLLQYARVERRVGSVLPGVASPSSNHALILQRRCPYSKTSLGRQRPDFGS